MMVKSETEDYVDGWSGEYDSLPLKERLKLLRLRKQAYHSVELKETVVLGQYRSVTRNNSFNGEEDRCLNSEEENMLQGESHKGVHFDAKMLDLPCFQASDCSLNCLSSPTSSSCFIDSHVEGSYKGIYGSYSISSSDVPSINSSPGSNLAVCTLQHTALSNVPPKAENEYDNDTPSVSWKSSMGSDSVSVRGAKVKHEIFGDFDDNLENIVLSERRQMLVSRLTVKSQKPCMQAHPVPMPKSYLFSRDAVQESVIGIQNSNGEHLDTGKLHTKKNNSDLCFASNTSKNEITGSPFTINQSSAPSSDNLHGAESDESKSSTSSYSIPYDAQEILISKALPSFVRVKVEPHLSKELDGGHYAMENIPGSVVPVKRELGVFDGAAEDDFDHVPLTDRVKLPPARTCSFGVSRDLNCPSKIEPSAVELANDHSESVKMLSSESNETGPSSLMEHKPNDRQENVMDVPGTVSSFLPAIRVKTEPVLSNEIDSEENKYRGKSSSFNLLPVKTESMEVSEDKLDHMTLLDRLMLLSSETPSNSRATKDIKCASGNASANLDSGLDVFESVEPISVIRPHKRKRTATDCAETALEEDAPALLTVLIEKGVSVEEIKLYGEPESNEVIDEAFCEDSFAELEAVICKVFSYRQPLLKLGPLGRSKGSKVTYCLGCLLSLVEQARCLKGWEWPVEWGWCRDLQAFIFVFPRHNRIVLERPEYGYATYFFELLDSVPVSWQIRRLVTAMKLTRCGRITLLENRPLKVGEDLSEGEARILSQYGWVSDTGLATMLNYCDRVVHDTNKERDGNEWRQKIGKMLINGYNGGRVVPNFLSKKFAENQSTHNPQIKQET